MKNKYSIPKSLLDGIHDQNIIPFIGAGVSQSIRSRDGNDLFVSWGQLLENMATVLVAENDADTANLITALIRKNEYQQAAGAAREALKDSRWFSILRTSFDVSYNEARPDTLNLCRKVWNLNSQLVITTNYDKSLQWTCPNQSDLTRWDIKSISGQIDFRKNGRVNSPTVWHLHGSIDNSTDLIVSPEGYKSFYSGSGGEIKTAIETLREIIKTRSLLFIGYSMSDSEIIEELLKAVKETDGAAAPHYILCRENLAQRIRDRKIPVIPVIFKEFNELPDLLANLKGLDDENVSAGLSGSKITKQDAEFMRRKSLDGWYKKINQIYYNKNFEKDEFKIFTHLVEAILTLSLLVGLKEKPGVSPEDYLAKSMAWWMTLSGKLGVTSVEAMLWDKFPNVCPYCQTSPHDHTKCKKGTEGSKKVPWEALKEFHNKTDYQPRRLSEWQTMFMRIYPVSETEDNKESFVRLAEEVSELAEAVRVFSRDPGYVLSELSDVFAWLMRLQNFVDVKNKVPEADRGKNLEELMVRYYPNKCVDCGMPTCVCAPILDKTVGRVAKEVPFTRGVFGTEGRFSTPDKIAELFLTPAEE